MNQGGIVLKSKKWALCVLVFMLLVFAGCTRATEEGMELFEQKKYDEALELFKRKQSQGGAGRGILRMGLVYWEQQKYEEARNAFQKALDAGTEKTGTLYNLLASCEMQLGDYQSALNHYNLGLQSEGNSAELTQEMEFNQIAAYEKLYEWESAKAKIEEYIAKYPDDEAAKKEAEIFADKIKIRGSGDYSLPSIFP